MTIFRVNDVTIRIGNRKLGDKGEYVARPSVLGNPFKIDLKNRNTRTVVIRKYREWLRKKLENQDPSILRALERLRKKALKTKDITLVCWCAPDKCHAEEIGQVLSEALSRNETFERGRKREHE